MTEAESFIKKHAGTATIIAAICASLLWMNNKFSDLKQDLHEIDKRLTKVETVIYIKGLVSHELAVQQERKKGG